jgi:hypothetical protein
MPLPNSLPWMESVDAKLRRAHEHLDTLETTIADFVKNTKRTLILKIDPHQNVNLMYWVDDPYPPMRLSAIVGDCVYNTRSALDNLICGLVRTTKPSSGCGNTKFPIHVRASEWNDSAVALKGIPEAARKLVKTLQPFNRPETSREIDPLHILNKLSNRDKHRSAMLTSGYMKNSRFAVHTNDGRIVYVISDRPLQSETFEEIPISIDPRLVTPQARVEATGTPVLAFRDSGPWEDRPVEEILRNCLRYVEDTVVSRFARFFVARS